jgi:hypothetical protein
LHPEAEDGHELSLTKRQARSHIDRDMKTNRSLGITCLAVVGLAFAYGLGYQHGSSSASARVNKVSSLKQIGLGFRIGHNDITRCLTTSGPVVIPSGDTPAHRR